KVLLVLLHQRTRQAFFGHALSDGLRHGTAASILARSFDLALSVQRVSAAGSFPLAATAAPHSSAGSTPITGALVVSGDRRVLFVLDAPGVLHLSGFPGASALAGRRAGGGRKGEESLGCLGAGLVIGGGLAQRRCAWLSALAFAPCRADG